jgi:hypothetical protein
MSKYHIHDPIRLKEVLYHDYLLIVNMQTLETNKIKLLSNLFSINPNSWRVVGITQAALEIFKEHEFQKRSGMRINRSHLTQRFEFYKKLLNMNAKIKDPDTFWNLYFEHDITVLASSSENMSKDTKALKNAYPVPRDERNLFQTSGYAWKHKEEEERFLIELYAKYGTKK